MSEQPVVEPLCPGRGVGVCPLCPPTDPSLGHRRAARAGSILSCWLQLAAARRPSAARAFAEESTGTRHGAAGCRETAAAVPPVPRRACEERGGHPLVGGRPSSVTDDREPAETSDRSQRSDNARATCDRNPRCDCCAEIAGQTLQSPATPASSCRFLAKIRMNKEIPVSSNTCAMLQNQLI